MAIPDFQTIMLPLLKFLADGEEHSLREAIEHLADEFELSEEERKELLPSGQQTVFHNRVSWARTYMKKADLIESTRRGYFKITPRGQEVLSDNPDKINVKFLKQFPEFSYFRKSSVKNRQLQGDDKMAIPDFQTIMLPLLKFLADGEEHSLREAIEHLADEFELSEEERKELFPSGQQAVFNNRVGWARTYMQKADLIESTRRGYFKITPRGQEVLSDNPDKINFKFLKQFPEFTYFLKSRVKKRDVIKVPEEGEKTALESLEESYETLRASLAHELLGQVQDCSPEFFEGLVVDLLVKMGYGGSREDAGRAVGRSGDEGIDGVINEDKLGLDMVYIQAKKWKDDAVIGRPEIQKFAGALMGQKAKKGVFITTASFSKEARDYASTIENKIVLIDGAQLAEYMIDFNVGVTGTAVYEVKKMDLDYFSEE